MNTTFFVNGFEINVRSERFFNSVKFYASGIGDKVSISSDEAELIYVGDVDVHVSVLNLLADSVLDLLINY